MNDRELMELAAKAAGYDKTMDVIAVCDKSGKWNQYVKSREWVSGRERNTYWNPLTDDGDALRLAVKLNLNVDLAYGDECIVRVFNEMHFFSERTDKDPYAATRRAIVLAAAEIGKVMP